ncbi:glycosyltransferase family 2 protein [Mongoliitalea daihaiensis]|uniref:glycosyltransferase family 2 protein n=1 Tax=Mongoliitalea daihaiensis TaxID=2782006 RepID=UPI001F385ABA|nr:glycosyltransferase [Mongoliitalea daihaiensis]UJP63760.1 glycosyltransferase [Mongoliitalea daihaiensis]
MLIRQERSSVVTRSKEISKFILPTNLPSRLPFKNVAVAPFPHQNFLLWGLVLLVFVATVSSLIFFWSDFKLFRTQRLASSWGYYTLMLSMIILAFKLSFLAFITIAYKFYKPIESVSDDELPVCTIIVPAYNEGMQVYDTLKSIVNSNYPLKKLEIITIDDGSKDDTWAWMQKAKRELIGNITILQQPHNKGKRHALYRAFHAGSGDIFITIDSDSIIRKNTLRNMASPFVVNPKCGAVAGNVLVLNKKDGFIPKMLNVSFAFSFEFIRSAQSVFGSVLCTPGALAAYRKEAVMNCLPDWINQRFLGQQTDIGEDRAMTNMILKQGYEVLFQKNAEVLTKIPDKYKNLSKMYIRWERSNVRENIMLSKFAFSNFREGSKIGTRILLLNQWIKVLMAYPALLLLIVLLSIQPFLILTSMLIGILVFSSIPAFFYAYKREFEDAKWAYFYSIYYTFSLFWITPYAIATANRRGWLTRELPKNIQ